MSWQKSAFEMGHSIGAEDNSPKQLRLAMHVMACGDDFEWDIQSMLKTTAQQVLLAMHVMATGGGFELRH